MQTIKMSICSMIHPSDLQNSSFRNTVFIPLWHMYRTVYEIFETK